MSNQQTSTNDAEFPSLSGSKGHKRNASKAFEQAPKQVQPPVIGGVSWNLPEMKRRRVGGAKPTDGNADTSMEDSEAVAKRVAEEKRAREKAEWLTGFASIEKQEDEGDAPGALRKLEYQYPRYTPYWKWIGEDVGIDEAGSDWLFDKSKSGHVFVWAQAYNKIKPGEDTVRMTAEALTRSARLGRIEDFDAGDYLVKSFNKKNGSPHPVMVITCRNLEAKKRLLANGDFTYETKTEIVSVWLQDPKALGSHVILDFKNAPANRDAFLEGVYKLFKDVIMWSTAKKKADKLVPVDFQIAKITRAGTAPAPVATKGIYRPTLRKAKEEEIADVWRVAFRLDETKARELGWTVPRRGGSYSGKGEITIETPPFCEHCISYSHSRRHCQWWSETSAAKDSKTSRPRDFIPMKWEKIESFTKEDKAQKAKADKGKEKEVEKPLSRAQSETPESRRSTTPRATNS
ncbi:hypothetical protein FRC01_006235 [Tulasnella sp. 417]|nr:hypothetical protein FRC01_006235 [Tulasnella sp. 417]